MKKSNQCEICGWSGMKKSNQCEICGRYSTRVLREFKGRGKGSGKKRTICKNCEEARLKR